ncbi:MAG: type 2 isopentenyl-diphosphate Delta-isomerase [Solirubrobacteraceae bacterium]|nr:type 2 isopentenyl-diphosphate Delta-isomerase [Patulibacter sp.]
MSATPAQPPEPEGAALLRLPDPAERTPARKDDHLRLAAQTASLHSCGTGLDRHRLVHRGLPGRDLAEVDLTTSLLGRTLAAPVIVSAMTGGTTQAGVINARLAAAATRHGIGLALGSGRALLRDPSLLSTYVGADRPPLLLANIGAPQLLAPGGLDDAARLVELLDADGLTVHLNPLQEAIQPEGEPQFRGLSSTLAVLCASIAPVPVVVKEVGFGLAADDVRELVEAGVAAIDVAGSGGTNWALVEGQRDPRARDVAAAFHAWGVPTAEAVRTAVAETRGRAAVIASGGLRDGVEATTCLALGATAAGFARELLLAAQDDRAGDAVSVLVDQLRIATWLTGAARSADLGLHHLQAPPTGSVARLGDATDPALRVGPLAAEAAR